MTISPAGACAPVLTGVMLLPVAPTSIIQSTPHGLLPAGTVTEHGTIVGRSFTAYELADGSYVSFVTVHGPHRPVAPLVVFA